ncbi:ribonuclease H-like domain protein [Vibrio phage 1.017.O._10N.286.55.C11]|nr:ribonuclease H-like domain protein [Vibrio phage 1.017.O._10N.286.55.C11]AUR85498.1 ribonuclease H-like domain protein [Vibrio phage 1.075.O._10N.286.55.B10]AUR87044.1 ribonuclease H-like domain protein [Vibrio phage 1.093.O._10N.286.55.E10]AUR87117.1 ribonuclease H-like domain protein [Vibrio phage 1.094.O._10N.286.55.E12]
MPPFLNMKYFVFDVECYKNYFLVMFQQIKSDGEKGRVTYIEMMNGDTIRGNYDRSTFRDFIENPQHCFIGFNSLNYDLPVVSAFIKTFAKRFSSVPREQRHAIIQSDVLDRNQYLKSISDDIIVNGSPYWKTYRTHGIAELTVNHIDIKEPAPGVMVSLKSYGGRMGSAKLQDLPIEPSATISQKDAADLRKYCENDLDVTWMLCSKIRKQIELRENLSEKYGVDMRSKSDAQMAEAIIKKYLENEGVHVAKRTGSPRPFKYRLPDWVEFKTPEFQEMLERVLACTFKLSDKGAVVMPKELNKAVEFNGAKYKFGIGGLHSQEKKQVVVPTEDQLFGEFDVASMYPSIIIEQELYPLHLGEKFLKVYSDIKDTRLKAKRSGNKVVNDTYKIVLNGSYGKFGSKYSFLYSPELLIQTTITGQLSLLMLIEKMTAAGGKVVSANTDGVNVLYSKSDYDAIHSVQFDWELTTGYELEYTPYLATYNRDVNNYIAVKEDGIKGKGAFAVGGLMKNPTNNVCIEAVIGYLADGEDIEGHIRAETDATKFLTIRLVTGGAVFREEVLGKTIRFYKSTDGDLITYKKNGNKVPKSEGCKPLMDLGDLPSDIDYDWYVNECKSILKDLGL